VETFLSLLHFGQFRTTMLRFAAQLTPMAFGLTPTRNASPLREPRGRTAAVMRNVHSAWGGFLWVVVIRADTLCV
jgi:hypothetical protein